MGSANPIDLLQLPGGTEVFPDFDGDWTHATSGGNAPNWLPLKPVRQYTNAFIWSPSERKILLGYKKRGFGFQMYNGFGGKIEAGESPSQAAKRELQEEARIDAPLEQCGILLFHDPSVPFMYLIHIFRATTWLGEPTETEEMRPEWFSVEKKGDSLGISNVDALPPVPFQKMWEDDPFWLPLLLDNKYFVGRADFVGCGADGTGGSMTKYCFVARNSKC